MENTAVSNGGRARMKTSETEPAADRPDDDDRSRRQISHDIHHELATIRLLATLLIDEPDAGPQSRRRARLILGETRWLEQLQIAYENNIEQGWLSRLDPVDPVRVDVDGVAMVEALRAATLTRITLTSEPVFAHVNRLALWRALRNVLDNAVRAAGRRGAVEVRVFSADGWANIEVSDDGPGFGAAAPGRSSLGLRIVADFITKAGGQFEIARGSLGGCRVLLQIPEALGPSSGTPAFESAAVTPVDVPSSTAAADVHIPTRRRSTV